MNVKLAKKAYKKALKERNEEIKKDHANGMSVVRMVSKYQLTSAMIYNILDLNNEK